LDFVFIRFTNSLTPKQTRTHARAWGTSLSNLVKSLQRGLLALEDQCFKNTTLILLSFEHLLLCLQGYTEGKEWMQNLCELTITVWNKIILCEIIENPKGL